MALIDRVKARITEQKLIELTNKDSKTATTINDTRLALAVTDTEAAIEQYCGVVYDDSDARHVRVAVRGVLMHLLLDSDLGPLAEERYTSWIRECEALARVTGRNRILPISTAAADEESDFSRDRFADFVPDPPASSDDDDDDD